MHVMIDFWITLKCTIIIQLYAPLLHANRLLLNPHTASTTQGKKSKIIHQDCVGEINWRNIIDWRWHSQASGLGLCIIHYHTWVHYKLSQQSSLEKYQRKADLTGLPKVYTWSKLLLLLQGVAGTAIRLFHVCWSVHYCRKKHAIERLLSPSRRFHFWMHRLLPS